MEVVKMRTRYVFCLIFCCYFSVVTGHVFAEEAGGFNLGQVVVTGTKTEHSLGESPVSVDVVTNEDIKKRNVKTVQEAIELLPGLRITKDSGSWGDKGKVAIRGFDAKHTLVLLDGQRFLGGHGNAVDVNSISVDMIERIELVKGPGSALYGSDAMGGVVNIITRKVPKKPFFTAEGEAGSKYAQRYSFTAGAPLFEGLGAVANYTYNASDGVRKDYDKYGEHIFYGNLGYEISPTLSIHAKPYYSEHKNRVVTATSLKEHYQRRFGLDSGVEWSPCERSNLKLRGSYFSHAHWNEDKSTDYKDEKYETEITYSRLLFDINTLTAGYQLQFDEGDDKGKNTSSDQYVHGFYVQNEIDLDPFVLVGGVRVDQHKDWGTQANPKASLLFKATEDLRFRGSFGTSFRAPTMTELYSDNWRMGPYLVAANPNLKPEESISFDVGAEYNFNDKVLAQATFFRNDIKNLISYEIGENWVTVGPPWAPVQINIPPWPMRWLNVDKAMTQGIELGLKTELLEGLRADINYTFMDTEDKETGKDLTFRPNHIVNFELSYLLPVVDVLAVFELKWTGRRYADAENTNLLGDYTVMNLALSKKIFDNIELFTRINNLGDRRKIFDEYDLDGIAAMVGARITF
jgi:outer membrane receptor for ferrienterochelin and colicins